MAETTETTATTTATTTTTTTATATETRIAALRNELSQITAARLELLSNGQSVSISGAFSATRVKLSELAERERAVYLELRALLRMEKKRVEVPKYA